MNFIKKLLVLTMLLSVVVIFAEGVAPTVGDGSEGSPYQIATLDNLEWLSTTTSVWVADIYFIQTADIDAADTQTWNGGLGFNPIGDLLNTDYSREFKGNYDGLGHTISNLNINRSTKYTGLFGYASRANIVNLSLLDVDIAGSYYVSGLVGYAYRTLISNCSATGTLVGTDRLGGLVAFSYISTISYCYANVNITGGTFIGGLVGQNNHSASISDCYARGSVSGNDKIGGLVGTHSDESLVSNCYSTGNVSGYGSNLGGMIGYWNAYECPVNNSVFDRETSGQFLSHGGLGYSTTGMQSIATYDDNDWNIVDATADDGSSIWKISSNANDGYPYLRWAEGHFITEPVEPDVMIISEVCSPEGNPGYDRFVEITNIGNASVDLTGWTLSAIADNAVLLTWPLSGNIDSGASLICGSNASTTLAINFSDATWHEINSGWNGASGDGARLYNSAKGSLVDEVISDTQINFEDSTIERKSDSTPHITQVNDEWISSDAQEATPGAFDQTLPVELSSFTAIQTANNYAQLNWATASEYNLIGYNIFRNQSDNLDSSVRMNSDIINATNSTIGSEYSYVDIKSENNTTYYYWLKSIELNNVSTLYGPIVIKLEVEHDTEEIIIPELTSLRSIYPNPFNPSTSVRFYVKDSEDVSVDVYNTKGQLIKNLTTNNYSEGFHDIVWNGTDNRGSSCASGVYFFKMKAGTKIQTKKAIMLK